MGGTNLWAGLFRVRLWWLGRGGVQSKIALHLRVFFSSSVSFITQLLRRGGLGCRARLGVVSACSFRLCRRVWQGAGAGGGGAGCMARPMEYRISVSGAGEGGGVNCAAGDCPRQMARVAADGTGSGGGQGPLPGAGAGARVGFRGAIWVLG